MVQSFLILYFVGEQNSALNVWPLSRPLSISEISTVCVTESGIHVILVEVIVYEIAHLVDHFALRTPGWRCRKQYS